MNSPPVVHSTTPTVSLRLFVVHAPEDAWFVEGFLLEALRLPEGEVLVSSKLELGAVIVNEIERGALSPVTVVVVSPAFLASPWAKFANQLAMHQSIKAANDGSATLVPAILAGCELPLLSRLRVPLDFRNQNREHWEAEAEKLRRKLAAPVPTVAPLPCQYPGIRPFATEDAARFHGRDKEVKDLLGRLRDGQRELYIIGPSGSGKSSMVAAGLVPRLHRSPELAEYDAMSDGVQTGLAVTVARRANGALNELSPGRREIPRRVLLRLAQFGDGTTTTLRQQARAALATAGDAPELDPHRDGGMRGSEVSVPLSYTRARSEVLGEFLRAASSTIRRADSYGQRVGELCLGN